MRPGARRRGLHQRIIPEGIETATQAAELRRLGCDSGQGYFFAPPMELAEFDARIGRLAPIATLSG